MNATMLRQIFNELRHRQLVDTQQEFGEKIGYKKAFTSQMLNGRTTIPDDVEDKILTAFPVLSREELQTLYSKVAGGLQTPTKLTGANISARKAFEVSAPRGIPFVPIKAQANYARHFTDPVFEDQLERFTIPGMPYDGDNFSAWQMEGDSMTYIKDGREDGIMDREYIITEAVPQEHWRSIKDYHVYAIVTDTLVTIKRLYKLSQFEYVMIPDNTDYDQEILDIEDVRQLWMFKRKLEWNAAPPRRIEITVKPRRDADGNKIEDNN